MTDSKTRAREIVDKLYDLGFITFDSSNKPQQEAIALMAAALDERYVLSDSEIEKAAEEYFGEDGPGYRGMRVFSDAARYAASRNLVRAIEDVWPSFDEFRKQEKVLRRKSGKDNPMDAYWAHDWLLAELKRRLGQ